MCYWFLLYKILEIKYKRAKGMTNFQLSGHSG